MNSILMITVPKSGSVYLAENLSNALGWPLVEVSLKRFVDDAVVPPLLKNFSRGDQVAWGHLPPSFANLAQLRHFGITRFMVHLRDPRQVTLSWTRYLEEKLEPTISPTFVDSARAFWKRSMRHDLVRGGFLATARVIERASNWGRPPFAHYSDKALAESMYSFPTGYSSWDLQRRLDWQIDSYLPDVIRWMRAWVEVADNPDSGFDILLTHFKELRDTPGQLFARIYDFYGLDRASLPRLRKPRVGEAHFRRGELDEWVRCFSPDQRERASRMIPDDWPQRFEW